MGRRKTNDQIDAEFDILMVKAQKLYERAVVEIAGDDDGDPLLTPDELLGNPQEIERMRFFTKRFDNESLYIKKMMLNNGFGIYAQHMVKVYDTMIS